ncbi:membrane protein insertase YidC [Candidatus Kaiserbacteria bacterium]|nr:MAG: membrane protein insertase YidC [Candidatus Kaiserbacteria bacterium]
MIVNTFNTFIFTPLYNGLILLIDFVPYADVGFAVIILTVLVKIILFPLAHKVAHMQVQMKELAPKLEELKEKYKEDKQEQTLKIMALYKEHNVRPFLSILVVFIQLPIILGLYWVFFRGGLPDIQLDLLYSFVPIPTTVNMNFLGLIDMGGRSVILALLAGATQYVHSYYALAKPKPRGENPSIKEDLAHSFHLQMKYVMPIIVVVISYTISAAIALYWLTSNLFAIGQELIVRRRLKHNKEASVTENHESGSN